MLPEPPISPREALVIIRNLPLDSATVASIRGGTQFRGWDNHMYMLTNIADAVQWNTYAVVAANSKRKPKAPKPLDRPKASSKRSTPMGNRFAAMARIARMNGEKKAQRKAQQNDESRRA